MSGCEVFGRTYDPEHPVCVSCERQEGKCSQRHKRGKQRMSLPVRPETIEGRRILICDCDLDSPNKWTNKAQGRQIYKGIRQRWERQLMAHAKPWFGKHKNRKRRLTITRYVPTKAHLMRDTTNIEGSPKPLEDALVNLGVLKDDAQQWLERLPVKQSVDPELAHPIVVLCIENITAEEEE